MKFFFAGILFFAQSIFAQSVLYYGDSHSIGGTTPIVGPSSLGLGFGTTLLSSLVGQGYLVSAYAVEGAVGCDHVDCLLADGSPITKRKVSKPAVPALAMFTMQLSGGGQELVWQPLTRRARGGGQASDTYTPPEYRLEAYGAAIRPDVVVFALGTNSLCTEASYTDSVCKSTIENDVKRTLAALDKLSQNLNKKIGCVWLVPPHMCIERLNGNNQKLWNRVDELAGGKCAKRAPSPGRWSGAAHSRCTQRKEPHGGRCEVVRLDTYAFSACSSRDGIHLSIPDGRALAEQAFGDFRAAIERSLR